MSRTDEPDDIDRVLGAFTAAIDAIIVEETEAVLREMFRVDGVTADEVERRMRLIGASLRERSYGDGLYLWASTMPEAEFRERWRATIKRRLSADLADLRPS